MVTLVVMSIVTIVLATMVYMASRSKTSTASNIQSSQAARAAMDMIARDLRSAGYGVDRDWANPQPPIAYIDSLQVLINLNLSGDVAPRDTTAYDPTGNPKPYSLSGTAYTPPIKYRTGAELVQWTLDLNNDGTVNGADVADPQGSAAQRTRNPGDYVLVRRVYGDSTGLVAGNNGGAPQPAALVRRPTDPSVPPMFRVYLRGVLWDWSAGPVPAAQLADIDRITVSVVAESDNPDRQGRYAESSYRTEVNSFRNVPDFGAPEYAVDGYVFNDLNSNRNRDGGEPGIPGAQVRLGALYTTTTDALGHYLLRAPAASYTLRHTPASGFYTIQSPDSFSVTLPPATSRNFADKALAGGHVHVHVYEDLNLNDTYESGTEPLVNAVRVLVTPGGATGYTDPAGHATLFAPAGGYSVSVEAPDSFLVVGTNPQSGSMADGDSTSHYFGISGAAIATVRGKVYRDTDRDGIYDAGEPGIEHVYVMVTPDGISAEGYGYTDVSGDYSIDVPANNPPGTQPYFVMAVAPSSHYATSSLWLGPLMLTGGQIVTGHNFGMQTFQIISLNASRVLSLVSGDLIEKDWSGSDNQWDTKGHKDAELVLGADAGGTDNVSVWFNAYNSSPLFAANPSYTRTAPQSVLALAIDRLDAASPLERPDVITGTRNALAGNFFVWLNQNSPTANLGYLPTAYSPGLAYRTADAGDVTAVLSADVAGNTAPDLIVATALPNTGRGTFEVWQNSGGAAPTFSRQETYPPAGNLQSNRMGEVTSMVQADFDGDGDRDLVIGTKTGNYSGELIFLELISKNNGSRFRQKTTMVHSGDAVTALTVCDVNGDGREDVVAGIQNTSSSGSLEYWNNQGSFNFNLDRTIAAPGIVVSLAAADLGGAAREADGLTPRRDIAMGWRQNETSYVGGLLLYSTDPGTLPSVGADPSGGSIANMVPAITANNFNYGAQPSPSLPYLTDLAVGMKITSTTGALVVFIR